MLFLLLFAESLAQLCFSANSTCGPANSTDSALHTDPLLCSFGTCICNFPVLDRLVAQTCTWIDFTGFSDTRAWQIKLEENCVALMAYRQCLADIYGSCYAFKINVASTSSRGIVFAGEWCSISQKSGSLCRKPEQTLCSMPSLSTQAALYKFCPYGCKDLQPQNSTQEATTTLPSSAEKETISISSLVRDEHQSSNAIMLQATLSWVLTFLLVDLIVN